MAGNWEVSQWVENLSNLSISLIQIDKKKVVIIKDKQGIANQEIEIIASS